MRAVEKININVKNLRAKWETRGKGGGGILKVQAASPSRFPAFNCLRSSNTKLIQLRSGSWLIPIGCSEQRGTALHLRVGDAGGSAT